MAYSNGKIVIPPAGVGHMELHVEWYEFGANATTNTSNIHLEGYISNPDSSALFNTYGNGHGTIRLYWHDNRQGEIYLNVDKNVTSLGGRETIHITKDFTVSHNSDGSLLGYAGIEWVKHSSLNWMPESTYINTGGYVALTTIPRTSVVNNVVWGSTWDDVIKVAYTRQSDAFREQITITLDDGSILKRVRNYISGSNIVLTDYDKNILHALAKTHRTVTYTLALETYTSDYATKIGTSSVYRKSYNFVSAPTVSATVEEVGITGKGVEALETVAVIGAKKISVTVTPKNWADIKSVTAYIGGRSTSVDVKKQSNGTYIGEATVSNLANANYMVIATDSRGTDGEWVKTGTFKAYSPPNILNLIVKRSTQISSDGTLTADGIYYNGIIGNAINAISITVSGAATGTLEPVYSGNKWNVAKVITGVNPKNSYKYIMTVTDSFGQSISRAVTLSVEIPLMQLGKTQVDVNGNVSAVDYYLKNNGNYQRLIDYIYPIGSILINENSSYDPNTMLGGTWVKIQDRFILGASNNTPIKSIGGQGASGLKFSNTEAAGYGLTNGSVGFANRVPVSSNNGDVTSNWPPYYAANIWRRIA